MPHGISVQHRTAFSSPLKPLYSKISLGNSGKVERRKHSLRPLAQKTEVSFPPCLKTSSNSAKARSHCRNLRYACPRLDLVEIHAWESLSISSAISKALLNMATASSSRS